VEDPRVTFFLALWGAVVASAAGLVQLLSFVRDRPKLAVTTTTTMSVNEPPEIGIDVANRGRQPTTLMDVAFEVDRELTIAAEGVELARGKPKIELSSGRVVTVLPGEVKRYRLRLEGWPSPGAYVDDPFRPFVVDSHGRRTWGTAEQVMAHLIGLPWEPPPNTPPHLLERTEEAVIASPVAARWKLWLPKELRRPTRMNP